MFNMPFVTPILFSSESGPVVGSFELELVPGHPIKGVGQMVYAEDARYLHAIDHAHQYVDRLHRSHPVGTDLVPEENLLQAWPVVLAAYSGMEQAMKHLVRMRTGGYPDRASSHNPSNMFRRMDEEEKSVVREAYAIYQSLHSYIPFQTADEFLDAIGAGWEPWRYWLLERNNPPTNHPGAMLEIWHALVRVIEHRKYEHRGLSSVDIRIENTIRRGLNRQWRGSRACQELIDWFEEHQRTLMNAFREACMNYNDGQVEIRGMSEEACSVLTRAISDITSPEPYRGVGWDSNPPSQDYDLLQWMRHLPVYDGESRRFIQAEGA